MSLIELSAKRRLAVSLISRPANLQAEVGLLDGASVARNQSVPPTGWLPNHPMVGDVTERTEVW